MYLDNIRSIWIQNDIIITKVWMDLLSSNHKYHGKGHPLGKYIPPIFGFLTPPLPSSSLGVT